MVGNGKSRQPASDDPNKPKSKRPYERPAVVWMQELETCDENAIAQAVADQFDVDAPTARADVAQFVRELRDRGLLPESE